LGADVYADRIRVKQILYNLLSNAIKFTPNSGRVRVECAVEQGNLEVSVSDTGIGVPPEEREAIFEKFHQVGSTSSQGTGLGLAITKRLVEQHGGTISLASDPGRGSRFTFTLALAGSSLSGPLDATPTGETAPSLPAGLKISVIEDNDENRALLEAMLGTTVAVTAFNGGAAALEACRRNPPDVAVTDIAMNGLDGLEFLKQMRADPRLRAIPVIAVSAHAMAGDRERFLAAGFDAYLEKPVEGRAALLQAIRKVLPS
jgi:CheY-like chemotaxis protein/anti-sigma regulatory factor (Ser/Thr protein kinase)